MLSILVICHFYLVLSDTIILSYYGAPSTREEKFNSFRLVHNITLMRIYLIYLIYLIQSYDICGEQWKISIKFTVSYNKTLETIIYNVSVSSYTRRQSFIVSDTSCL